MFQTPTLFRFKNKSFWSGYREIVDRLLELYTYHFKKSHDY